MPEISIGTLSKRTGMAVSAIRYYEEIGLIHPNRTASGQRRFAKSDIRRIAFVIATQRLGFSLPEIRSQLALLPNNRTPTVEDWSVLSHHFQAKINARIQDLERLRDTLDGCIGCGCLSLKKCALYNPNDIAAKSGPGPRFLLAKKDPG